jgi:hypothetical protein
MICQEVGSTIMTCNVGTKFEMDECEHPQGKDNIKEE